MIPVDGSIDSQTFHSNFKPMRDSIGSLGPNSCLPFHGGLQQLETPVHPYEHFWFPDQSHLQSLTSTCGSPLGGAALRWYNMFDPDIDLTSLSPLDLETLLQHSPLPTTPFDQGLARQSRVFHQIPRLNAPEMSALLSMTPQARLPLFDENSHGLADAMPQSLPPILEGPMVPDWSTTFAPVDVETHRTCVQFGMRDPQWYRSLRPQAARPANDSRHRSAVMNARVRKQVRMKRSVRAGSVSLDQWPDGAELWTEMPDLETQDYHVPWTSNEATGSSVNHIYTTETPLMTSPSDARPTQDRAMETPSSLHYLSISTPSLRSTSDCSDPGDDAPSTMRAKGTKFCSVCGSNRSLDKQRKWHRSEARSLLCRPCFDEQRWPKSPKLMEPLAKQDQITLLPGYRVILPKHIESF